MNLDDENASAKLDRLFQLILLGLFDLRTRIDAIRITMNEEQQKLILEIHRQLVVEHADDLMKTFFS